MDKDGLTSIQKLSGEGSGWRIVDDSLANLPVGAAELDSIEAFLMPLLNAIVLGQPGSTGHVDDAAERE